VPGVRDPATSVDRDDAYAPGTSNIDLS
jgi:hypothetical protein